MKYNYQELEQIKRLITARNYRMAQIELESYHNKYPKDEEAIFYDVLLLKSRIISEKGSNKEELEEVFHIFWNIYEKKGIMSYNALYEMGKIRSYQNDFDSAISCFSKLLKESPYERNNLAIIALAQAYWKKGEVGKAKELLEQERRKTNNPYVILELAKIEAKMKNTKEAKRLIAPLPKEDSDFYRKVLWLKGRIAANEKDYKQALDYLNQALGSKKDHIYWSAILEIAKIYEKEGRLEDALELCIRLKKNKQTFDGELTITLGSIYEHLGRKEEARNCYQETAKGSSISFTNRAYLKLGQLEMEEQNYEGAKKWLTIVAESNLLLSINAYLNLAYIAIREEDYDTCYKLIERATKLESNQELQKSIEKIKLYVDIKTKKKIVKENMSYSEQQMLDYNEKKAIDYIKKQHAKNTSQEFASEVNIEDIFYRSKEEIKLITPNINCLTDNYILTMPKIGYVNGISTDQIKVICLPNTDSIISIYPTTEEDSTEEVIENERPKKKIMKRKSQIEKFNDRYKKGK